MRTCIHSHNTHHTTNKNTHARTHTHTHTLSQVTRPLTPEAVPGRKHMVVQTDNFLEEIADRPVEVEVSVRVQTYSCICVCVTACARMCIERGDLHKTRLHTYMRIRIGISASEYTYMHSRKASSVWAFVFQGVSPCNAIYIHTYTHAQMETQTDPFMDRPPSPLFLPMKTGVDRETQILEGDLFDFDFEVEPILQVSEFLVSHCCFLCSVCVCVRANGAYSPGQWISCDRMLFFCCGCA